MRYHELGKPKMVLSVSSDDSGRITDVRPLPGVAEKACALMASLGIDPGDEAAYQSICDFAVDVQPHE